MAEEKDLGLHNYRVDVLLLGKNSYTITANTPQEAQQKVLGGEGGRAAGAEGPVALLTMVHDQAIIESSPPNLQRWAVTVTQALEHLKHNQSGAQVMGAGQIIKP